MQCVYTHKKDPRGNLDKFIWLPEGLDGRNWDKKCKLVNFLPFFKNYVLGVSPILGNKASSDLPKNVVI